MRKNVKRFIVRCVLAVILLACAAVGSLLIKETIDSKTPESSLPLIEVSVGYTKLSVVRADYQWNFFTRKVYGPALSAEGGDVPYFPQEVMANTRMVIVMSNPDYESIKVSRSDGLYNPEYIEIYGDVYTPTEPGDYTYKIEVSYKRGSLLYYTAVRVTDGGLIIAG